VNRSTKPPSELSVYLFVVDDRQYRARATHGKFTYEHTFTHEISATIREDMRLLRWKAVGLHDEGDALLNEVGARISNLLFPPDDRINWEEVIQGRPNRVYVRFSKGTEELLHLPWELLNIDGRFVLQDLGSHIIREVSAFRSPERIPGDLRVLHISFGVDSSLRLDEERAAVLNEIPDDCEATFLLNPPTQALDEILSEFRPSILMISGHGAYDDIADKHRIETLADALVTEELIALAGKYECGLLLLWTCESARLGSGIAITGTNERLPVDVVSFTYPVRSDTAIAAASQFIRAIVEGQTSARAVGAIRDLSTAEDIYSFFNVVHYHVGDHPFFQIDAKRCGISSHSAPACGGREEDLFILDHEAYAAAVTTVLAPRESGASAVLLHWSALKSQSRIGTVRPVRADQVHIYRQKSSPDRWLLVDDLEGNADLGEINQQVVRIVAPDTFKPRANESLVILRGIDHEYAVVEVDATFGGRIRELVEHPLVTIPTFLKAVAGGLSPDQATAAFEAANKMPQRYAKLGDAGRLFGSLIFMMRGEVRLPDGGLVEYADHLDRLSLDGKMLLAGVHECIAANVVFGIGEKLVLSPDFYLLADKWFPNWRSDHIRIFQTFVAAFATVDSKAEQTDVEMGQSLLGWAIGIGAWREASLLCIQLSSWYGEQGKLPEMEEAIHLILPHVDGEEKLILEGHLISLLSHFGRFKEALELQEAMEKRIRSLPAKDHEYYLNLIACLTQQIDCLVGMDRLKDALAIWQKASDLLDSWPEPEPSTRPRLLAQRATILKEAREYEPALSEMNEAIGLAEKLPSILCAELRASKADILWRMDRIDEAEAELQIVAPFASGGALRSRYLHLKGILMEHQAGPQWIEHVLESLEHDRERGDIAGIAVSLITLARIFIDQNDIERAKQRLREALPYVQRSGLQSIMGVFARLWGEIAAADGSIDSAKTWLKDAIKAFDAGGQTGKANDVRRLLERL
jgi:tetratricopeptide (TPR) repeat protein